MFVCMPLACAGLINWSLREAALQLAHRQLQRLQRVAIITLQRQPHSLRLSLLQTRRRQAGRRRIHTLCRQAWLCAGIALPLPCSHPPAARGFGLRAPR